MMVLIARRDDGWRATWSRADAVLVQPLDPMAAARSAAELLRKRTTDRLPVL